MKSKVWILVLIVSISLNLALMGFMLGRHSGQAGWVDMGRQLPHWARSLPEPRREQIRPLVIEHLRSVRQSRRGLRNTNAGVHAAILAEPFDAQQLEEALVQVSQQQSGAHNQSHDSFVQLVAALSLQERQQFAQRMAAPPLRPGRPGRPPKH